MGNNTLFPGYPANAVGQGRFCALLRDCLNDFGAVVRRLRTATNGSGGPRREPAPGSGAKKGRARPCDVTRQTNSTIPARSALIGDFCGKDRSHGGAVRTGASRAGDVRLCSGLFCNCPGLFGKYPGISGPSGVRLAHGSDGTRTCPDAGRVWRTKLARWAKTHRFADIEEVKAAHGVDEVVAAPWAFPSSSANEPTANWFEIELRRAGHRNPRRRSPRLLDTVPCKERRAHGNWE